MRTAASPTVDGVLAALSRRQGRLVDAYVRELVPGYSRELEPRLVDVREAAERTMTIIMAALVAGRELTATDARFIRPYFRRALVRGATTAELMRSAQIWHRVVLRAAREVGGDAASPVISELSAALLQFVDVLGEAAVETLRELEHARQQTARESRRQALAGLLAGDTKSASTLSTARACGLELDATFVVVSAAAVAPPPDPGALTTAAVALARAGRDAIEPLFVLRDDEVVLVRAAGDDDLGPYAEALDDACASLLAEGVRLGIGLSARRTGLSGVPVAYAQAVLAREELPRAGGVLALPLLKPLDYLFLRAGDDTAWSLVAPRIRAFVEADLSQASLLTDTLMAYVDCSLNVKAAAERLFVHPNTAHYRLGKIEDQTGCDLRHLEELQELVVAVRLARRQRRTAE